MANIVIISPKFDISFWGLEHSVPLMGKRATLPVAALPLLAALTPEGHDVTLIDENAEAINWEVVSKADMVCLTGMCVQRRRMEEILEELRERDKFVVVGGPYVTVEKHIFDDMADVIFIGEADETWPVFVEEWEQGEHKDRYTQADKTDMTKVPAPRIDLIKTQYYTYGSMQISRGCPYQCEFCDIIITFGRKPRLKTKEQVIAELDNFLKTPLRLVFVVDDNLIGNKKGIKPILREIVKWQQEHNYPLTLFSEASLDLAEDEELMQLMGEANFQACFVGVESPNEEALKETKKFQNVRPKDGTVMERIRRIQDHGIELWGGMILGFDHDDETSFEIMPEYIKEMSIAHSLIGILHAIPTTPLYNRLKEAGRIDDTESYSDYGTNVIPLKLGREQLLDGYVSVMEKAYDPDAYFDRIDELYINRRFKYKTHTLPFWRKRMFAWWKRSVGNIAKTLYLYRRVMREIPERDLIPTYKKRFWRLVRTRPFEPHLWLHYIIKITMHYHYYTIIQAMKSDAKEAVGTW